MWFEREGHYLELKDAFVRGRRESDISLNFKTDWNISIYHNCWQKNLFQPFFARESLLLSTNMQASPEMKLKCHSWKLSTDGRLLVPPFLKSRYVSWCPKDSSYVPYIAIYLFHRLLRAFVSEAFQARRIFLKLVHTWKAKMLSTWLYNVSLKILFNFQQTTEPNLPENLLIAINKSGVNLIDPATKVSQFRHWYLSDISVFHVEW